MVIDTAEEEKAADDGCGILDVAKNGGHPCCDGVE